MKEAVYLRIKKAQENLAVLPRLVEDEFYGIVVNRAYYAMFSAVQALLLLHEIHVKTHKGLHLKFLEHYVQPGIFPVSMATTLAQTEDLRVEADYDFDDYITLEEAQTASHNASAFVSAITDYLRSQNFLDD